MDGSVLSLRPQTLRALTDSLEYRSPLRRDWRGLAECIGFSAKHIRRIEAPHQQSSTRMVLDAWHRSGKSSVRKLIIALRYINFIECTRILEKEPSLQGENFEELYRTADRLKNNSSEKQLLFPEFADGELIIGDDEWGVPTSPPQPVHCEHILHEPLLSRDAYHQNSSIPLTSSTHSPPPPPVTPIEPTTMVPSRKAVFISYYPDPNTTTKVAQIARQLEANDFRVEFASESLRQMEDVDFKLRATMSAYNIVVVCTPQYFNEDQQLVAQPGYRSKISVDRKLIRDIFFKDDKRIICVGLDQDGPNYKCCIPDLYAGRPFYKYPSQVTELLYCVSDIPRYQTPEPVARIPLVPTKISYEKEAKEWNSRYFNSPRDMRRESAKISGMSRAQAMALLSTPISRAPRKIHPPNKQPIWKKLLSTAIK